MIFKKKKKEQEIPITVRCAIHNLKEDYRRSVECGRDNIPLSYIEEDIRNLVELVLGEEEWESTQEHIRNMKFELLEHRVEQIKNWIKKQEEMKNEDHKTELQNTH